MREIIEDMLKSMRENLGQNPGTKIYHYTNVKGLQGIISDRVFWVTKSEFLNDSMELKYTLELLEEICNSLDDKELSESINKICQETIESSHDINCKFCNYHILSFSLNPDSLTVWSSYSNFEGYCLEFDHDLLEDDFHENVENKCYSALITGKVIYSEEKQKQILKEIINYFLVKDSKFVKDEELLLLLLAQLTTYSIFFKSPKFKHEEEFRIVFNVKSEGYFEKIKLNEVNQSLKPYIEISFINKEALGKVIIGPRNNQDIAKNGCEYLLRKHNYNNVEVTKSDISLRY